MIMEPIRRLMVIILTVVCIIAYSSWTFRQREKADDEFEIAILKDINATGRKLKESGLEDKTVRALKYALQDVQWTTRRYVQDTSYRVVDEMILYALVVYAVVLAPSPSRRKEQKNSIV